MLHKTMHDRTTRLLPLFVPIIVCHLSKMTSSSWGNERQTLIGLLRLISDWQEKSVMKFSDSFIYLGADCWKNLPFVNVKSDFPVAIVDNNPSDVSLIEIRLFLF